MAPAPAPQPIVTASADPESVALPVPLPPQRPQDLIHQVALIEPPLPPARVAITAHAPSRATASFEPILGFNVKAAVRSLFEPKTALLDTGFSSGALDDLSTTRFTGPATKPLPRLDPQAPGNMWAKAG
jgi:hypothetical protein